MSDKNDKDKKKLGDIFRKGVRGLRDRMNYDITDLISAVHKNDAEQVERVLYAGVGPNKKDGINRRALPMAVDNNHVEIVKLLLKAKADPSLPGSDGDLPLRKAVYWENESIAAMLLQAGADKHQPNREGVSAMLEAKRSGYEEMADLLDNFKDARRTRQVAKDRQKHEAQKKRMEEARAAQKEQEKEMAKKQEERLIKMTESLEDKYDVPKRGYFPAMIDAIIKKDARATKLFIDKTENLNQISDKGTTPLLIAVSTKNNKLATYLLLKDADPFFYAPLQKHSPFSKAITEDMVEFIEAIVERYKTKIAEQCNDEEQLLSPQFLSYKNPKMFDLLLSSGANPIWGGLEGMAPVVKAVEKGSIAMLPVLARHNFDIDQLIDGKTLLEWAIQFNRIDWVNGLLEEDADPTVTTSEGYNALELAKMLGGREEIVKLLEAEYED